MSLLQGRFLVSSPSPFLVSSPVIVKIICNCRGKSDLHNEYKINTRLISPINFLKAKCKKDEREAFFSRWLSEPVPGLSGIPSCQSAAREPGMMEFQHATRRPPFYQGSHKPSTFIFPDFSLTFPEKMPFFPDFPLTKRHFSLTQK